jgi:hypothetical protein
MKVLLDNCLDIRAKSLVSAPEVEHVLDRGWATLSNGNLLATAAAHGFDVFLTVDKNLRF